MRTGLTLLVTEGHARAVSDGLTAAACNVLCPDARGSAECRLPRLQLLRTRFGLVCVRLAPEQSGWVCIMNMPMFLRLMYKPYKLYTNRLTNSY